MRCNLERIKQDDGCRMDGRGFGEKAGDEVGNDVTYSTRANLWSLDGRKTGSNDANQEVQELRTGRG